MNIVLNGNTTPIEPSAKVLDLLESLSLADKRVAVEINGEIVPRSQHGERGLAAGDRVEVVVAVGGG
jgi:sulfur carrier protein